MTTATYSSTAMLRGGFWRRPRCLSSRVVAPLWLAAMAYGLLMPFDFSAPASWWELVCAPTWLSVDPADLSSLGRPVWQGDVLINLLLFMPAGLLLRRALRADGRGAVGECWRAVAVVFVCSYGLECLQSLQPHRFASLNDVLLNVSGAAVGAMAGGGALSAMRRLVFGVWVCLSRARRGDGGRTAVACLFACGAVLAVYACLAPPALPARASDAAVNWRPLADHLKRSPDVMLSLLLLPTAAYLSVPALALLASRGLGVRRRVAAVVLPVAGASACVEFVRSQHGVGRADVTAVVIALCAAGVVVAAAYLVGYAIRRSCRRRQSRPVAHERRHRPHDYGFALMCGARGQAMSAATVEMTASSTLT